MILDCMFAVIGDLPSVARWRFSSSGIDARLKCPIDIMIHIDAVLRKPEWRSIRAKIIAKSPFALHHIFSASGIRPNMVAHINIHGACLREQLRHKSTSSHGNYDHLPFLFIKLGRPSIFAKRLENWLFSLLRDLNFYYGRLQNEVYHNIVAQKCAFQRHAAVFEDILEEIAEDVFSSYYINYLLVHWRLL